MHFIYEYEKKMWDTAKSGDKSAFAGLVSEAAVMVCGGYRCSGAEYAEMIGDFGISDYEISNFEVVAETDTLIQVHYVVRTQAQSAENADMAGIFHVTSTWNVRDNPPVLVFNMDSRIFGE